MSVRSHLEYEIFWQKLWEKENKFKVDFDSNTKKIYILDMFPYASGSGLHVGHVEGYTASDIFARYKKSQGYNVFVPMGFDAFGLPAEQYALETGNDPQVFTYKNINNFKKQLKRLGKMVDWDQSFATCDENYYKVTQRIFKLLYDKGLAHLKDVEVNFCPELGTVLANDEIIVKDDKMYSERGNYLVYKKPMKQWVLKITNYSQRLLEDLSLNDWPDSIKEIQKNWIGKKTGANIWFQVPNKKLKIQVFTTRPDTIYGVSYLVLAPENPLLKQIITEDEKKNCNKYIKKAKQKTSVDRQINKNKTGVFTGSFAINPINNKKIPIWISDYVLADYATGALMAVPAHDKRDFEFAKKFGLDIIKIIDVADKLLPYEEDGVHINSPFVNGLKNEEAIKTINNKLEALKIGTQTNSFKLRDWIFSRQRYWGEPFPVYYDDKNQVHLVEDSELPLLLPKMKNIKPSGEGRSPLANLKSWISFKKDGKTYSYDTNTMPQLAGSSWYYIAHLLKDGDKFLDFDDPVAQKRLKKWLPVDLYVGGAEHAVGHLLYSRFWHKFLHDIGYLKSLEPFKRLVNQGMILIEGQKMSKSKGRVISPDDIFKEYGADALRLYEMFMGPINQDKTWSDEGMKGARKFIDRVINIENFLTEDKVPELSLVLNQTIKKVEEDYEKMQYNTAISQLMIFVNEVYRVEKIDKNSFYILLKLLNPICPHITEELNKYVLKSSNLLIDSSFPKYKQDILKKEKIELIFQINGKIRGKEKVAKGLSEKEVLELAKQNHNVGVHLKNKEIVKTIFIKDKIVNFVVK